MSQVWETIAEIPASPASRVYGEGWQSWSPTDWMGAAEPQPRPEHPWQRQMRFRSGLDLPDGEVQGEGILAVEADGETHVFIDPKPGGSVVTIRSRFVGDRLVVRANGQVRQVSCAATGGAALAGAVEAVWDLPAVAPPPRVWCSWYEYFGGVTEADLLEAASAIKAADLPIDVLQLDDGWQKAVGDWDQLSGLIPDLRGLVRRLREHGYRAGIWVAPFTVAAGSDLARQHPDWCLPGAGWNWDGDLFGLDLTHPDARDYVWTSMRALADAGFDYIKLDFLYSGAIPGRRWQDVEATSAYRSGMELLRDAFGADSYLVGCGAPLLPSLGYVDAMRVGADVFHDGGQGGIAPLRPAAAVAARDWQHGRLWANDPDCLIARPSFGRREEWTALVERHGGLRSISDRIADLDDWGLQTARRVLSSGPGAAPLAHAAQVLA